MLEAFPGQPMDFFASILSRLADTAVRDWLQQQQVRRGLGVEMGAGFGGVSGVWFGGAGAGDALITKVAVHQIHSGPEPGPF